LTVSGPADTVSFVKPSRISSYNTGFLNNRTSYWLGEWMLENFDPRLAHLLTRVFSELVYVVMGGSRRNMTANVMQVLRHTRPGLPESELRSQAFRITHKIFMNRGVMYTDHSLLTSHRSPEGLARYEMRGNWTPLTQTLASGRGAIFASAHLGNWQEGAIVVSRLLGNGPQSTPIRTLLFKNSRANRVLEGFSRRGNLRHTYVTGDGDPFTMVELVRGLRRGELLALLADVAWDSRWVDVPFFGRPTRFPVGPARLARLAEVPIFPAFCIWEGTREFVCAIGDPIEVAGTDPLEAERDAVAKLAAVIERFVTDHLDQWFNFTAVWGPPPEAPAQS
jgi:KDO2-lipid IV(A) lauroyltransferase